MAFLGFKTKAEREMERKLAIRRTMNELNRCKKSMEKKKTEMMQLAARAKSEGLSREFATAKNGLISIMKYSQTLEAVRMRLQIAETMRDMSSASMKAVKSMGDIGKELSSIMEKTDFTKNQAAFEMGSLKMEEMMSQMDDMLESTSDMSGGYSTETSEDEWEKAAGSLIEASLNAKPSESDKEIDALLQQVSQQESSLK